MGDDLEHGAASTNWPLIALVFAGAVTASVHIGKVPPALPDIRAELSVGLVAAGWIVSIFALIGTMGGIFAGLVTDRLGHSRMIKGALVAFAAGGVLGAIGENSTSLLVSRVIEGAAYIVLAVATPSLIAVLAAPRDRNLAVGLYGMGVPVGMSIALLASPPIIAAIGWRGLWWSVVGLSLVMLALMLLFVRARPSSQGRRTTSFLRDIGLTISRPGPNILMGCFLTYTAQWTAVMAWLPTFIVEQREASLGVASVMTALVVMMNIGGNWLGSVLLHRGVPRWALISAGTLAMGLTALAFFPEGLPDMVRYGLCLAFSLLGGMQPASLTSGAPAHAPSPDQLGTTNGYWMQGSQLGQLLGAPAVAAVVTISGGWALAGPALALGTVVNVILALWLRKLER